MVSNADTRLAASGIELPPASLPFGPYVRAVQTGSLLFLTGMLTTVGLEAESPALGVPVELEVILEVSA
jgi:enamine deaminase RidA (YjgF/YER057c/UK114 family)